MAAPVTEVGWWTIHESVNRDDFLTELKAAVERTSTELTGEVLGADVGEVAEDKNKFAVFIGRRNFEV